MTQRRRLSNRQAALKHNFVTLLYSTGLNVYVGLSPPLLLHTYWDWVSMLMLMLLKRVIYFVFVFRMLLPFFIHVRES